MRNYIQPGHAITLAAPYDVVSGAGLLVGSIFGVASHDALSGAEVETQLTGVIDLAKVASQAWTAGAKVYWDNTAKRVTNVASGNTLVGVAVLAVGAGADEIVGRVRLNGSLLTRRSGCRRPSAHPALPLGRDLVVGQGADQPEQLLLLRAEATLGQELGDLRVGDGAARGGCWPRAARRPDPCRRGPAASGRRWRFDRGLLVAIGIGPRPKRHSSRTQRLKSSEDANRCRRSPLPWIALFGDPNLARDATYEPAGGDAVPGPRHRAAGGRRHRVRRRRGSGRRRRASTSGSARWRARGRATGSCSTARPSSCRASRCGIASGWSGRST